MACCFRHQFPIVDPMADGIEGYPAIVGFFFGDLSATDLRDFALGLIDSQPPLPGTNFLMIHPSLPVDFTKCLPNSFGVFFFFDSGLREVQKIHAYQSQGGRSVLRPQTIPLRQAIGFGGHRSRGSNRKPMGQHRRRYDPLRCLRLFHGMAFPSRWSML